MSIAVTEIAELIGAAVDDHADIVIRGVAALEQAAPDQLVFAESRRYVEKAAQTRARALVVGTDFPDLEGKLLLRVENPRLAFLRIMELFVPAPGTPGIHPAAQVAQGATLGEALTVEACAVIEASARIGSGSRIGAGSYVGRDVDIGQNCDIGPNVTILHGVTLHDRVVVHAGTVIGGDGFGYRWLRDHHHKIPQLGTVVIEDDVEIGCATCIDRGTLGETRIRRGAKIDNLVQIAHNNDIGEDVVLTGQVGTAGSVTIGSGVMVGGQAGISDHVTIGAGARVGATAGVASNVSAGETVMGVPARPAARARREAAVVWRLPELRKQIQAQERLISELVRRLERLEGADS